jgi:hypothetical protein
MIIKKKFCLILFLIFISQDLALSSTENRSQNNTKLHMNKCVISNQKYPIDYLYTTNQLDKRTNVQLHQLDELDEFDQIIWKLIPVVGDQNTSDNLNKFYLKSELFDYYLCSSDKFQQVITSRYKFHSTRQRLVQVKSKQGMDECKWIFEKVNQVKGSTYIIKNSLHNEMLYAGSNSQKITKYRRNVYLWPHVPTNSEQFKWYVVCSSHLI